MPRWVWGTLLVECLALLVWAWSKQLRNAPLRPWERWGTLAGAAAAVVVALPLTWVSIYCLPVALIGAAPGLIVGEVISDLAKRRG